MESEIEEQGSLFDEVWETVSTNIDKVAFDDNEKNFLLSVAMGGSVAAETFLENCPTIKPYWGEGSIHKTQEICNLFSLIMLSQCYRWITERPNAKVESNLPKEVMGTKIMYIHNVIPEAWMMDFSKLDEQFNYDLNHHPHIIHLSGILIAKCCSICGHQCLNWDKINFPISEFHDIMQEDIIVDGAPLQDKVSIDSVAAAISNGIAAMNQYLEQATK